MKSKRKFLSIFAILFALVFALSVCFFAACGNKDDDEKDNDTTTEQDDNTDTKDDDDDEKKDDEKKDEATVTEVSVSPSTLNLVVGGDAKTLTATVTMSDKSAYTGDYAWESSDGKVASVTGSGATATVTAVAASENSVTITVTAGGKEATCSVTVAAAEVEPESITTAEELTAAFTNGGDYVLEADIEGSFTVATGANVTLDLGEKTISTATTLETAADTITVESGASLTITGTTGGVKNTYVTSTGTSGTSLNNAAAVYVEGALVVDGGTIESTSIGVKAEDGGQVTVNGGTITSGYFAMWLGGNGTAITVNNGTISGTDKGIILCGDSNYGHADENGNNVWQTGAVQTLTINDGTFSCTNDSVICTYGQTNRSSSIVNINGGTFTSTEITDGTSGTAMPTVYIPNGTVTITDGTFNGSTPLEVRGGTIAISGGTFNCTATLTSSAKFSSSGATSYGYALSVFPYPSTVQVNETDADNIPAVTVTDGTFDGALYVATSDDFSGTKYTYPETATFSISGGTFTEDPSLYVADGYTATPGDTYWTVAADASSAEPVSGTGLLTIDSLIESGALAKSSDDITGGRTFYTSSDGTTIGYTANNSKKIKIGSGDGSYTDEKWGNLEFTNRLQLANTSSIDGSCISLTVTGACTVTVIANNSSTDTTQGERFLKLYNSSFTAVSDTTYSVGADGSAIVAVEIEISALGSYLIGSTSSSINIYAIAVEY